MSYSLLVVNDDENFLGMVRERLENSLSIESCTSEAAAVHLLQRSDFDILISGPAWGETHGLDFLNWVHLRRAHTVRLAVVQPSSVHRAIELIPDLIFDYLFKNSPKREFVQRIKRAADYRRLLLSDVRTREALERVNRQSAERVRRATHELMNLNEELGAANRAKDQFLAAMSHELRTPLTAVTGAVRLLRSPNTTPAKADAVLEILDRNVGTLKTLLDDLLDCSRIAAGKLHFELVPTDLNECVTAAVDTMRAKAADARVEIRVSATGSAQIVHGNPLRLQQIAWNLIDNAIKFTAAGGYVEVSVCRREENIEFSVRDSGIGLPESDLVRIFSPFAQIRESDSTQRGGLGLGLALVRSLTQMHKGRVRAESDGIGHGSRFVVTLPAAGAAPFSQAA